MRWAGTLVGFRDAEFRTLGLPPKYCHFTCTLIAHRFSWLCGQLLSGTALFFGKRIIRLRLKLAVSIKMSGHYWPAADPGIS